jgi:cell division transport system permease protein
MLKIKKIERSLGVARGKREYDLPLNKDKGNNFLKILMGLMTFLAILALSSSFVLSEIKQRWSSGLENKATVEIVASDENGTILSKDRMAELTQRAENFLKEHPAVENVEVMQEQEIAELISPWLGEDLAFDQIPLPSILTVSFKDDVVFDMDTVTAKLQTISPNIKLDTHESWLNDVLRFAGALKFAAIMITLIIIITTIVGVAGAVQARMAIYHEELELLHLMGAGDRYIANQLQRYILFLCFQGAAIGAVIGGLTLLIIGWVSGRMDISLLPDFTLNSFQTFILVILPVLVALLGMLTARHTVLRVLEQMP